MKKLSNLKNTALSRGFFAAKSAVRMIPSFISGETDPRALFKDFVGSSIHQFVDEVGELKGSFLKAAQILSLYGEYYLPKEINEVLKKVQSQSHYLAWEKISPLIPARVHAEIEIEVSPLAAASIGQVHRGRIKSTGEEVVLKIQYPGIRKAIDLDMKLIKTFLSMGKILPKKMNLDPIYGEIRKVLLEEMDYEHEAKKHAEYITLMANVPGCSVPKLYPEYCSSEVIVSEYVKGQPLSQVPELSQEERNALGATLFTLFLHEIFRGHLIQTDSHAGNYLYEDRKLTLVDFGACLAYPEKELGQYRKLITELYFGRKDNFMALLGEIISKGQGKYEIEPELLWRYCLLAASPLRSEDFDWGSTTLPDELFPLAQQLVTTGSIEVPPHDFIFLDRKLLGLFSLLRSLKARFNVKAISGIYITG